MAWDDFNNKRILGTVDVQADGSAYFSLPPDRFVYFQLLDANGMMIQSMRSGTIVRPGEVTGCVGCHDSRHSAAPNSQALALRRAAQSLRPWHGSERLFNYFAEVQPVFDRHCVRCHDYGKEGAKKLLLAGDIGTIFNLSYVELRSKKLVTVVGAGPTQTLPPYSWGSGASKLVAVLRGGHPDRDGKPRVNLPAEDFDRIVTWIDLNAPYYPVYASAYRENLYGRCVLDGSQLGELAKLGLDVRGKSGITAVSFTRPEMSPGLAKVKATGENRYARALEIIRAGAAALRQRPAAEMPGFRYEGVEAQREARYAEMKARARSAGEP